MDHFEDILTEQQKLLRLIELENIEDLASPKGRSLITISYALAKLQFTQEIARPDTYESPKDTKISPIMVFQQKGKNQPIDSS